MGAPKEILSDFVRPGRVNMIIDGAFGSTGKGLIASVIARHNHVDVACASLSPNAGHTFYEDGQKKVTKLLPVSGIIGNDRRQQIYLTADSVIDVDLLLREIEQFDIDPERIAIHPRAAVVTQTERDEELQIGGIEAIASTQSGTGAARASKIMRTNPLAGGDPRLAGMVHRLDLSDYLRQGLSVLVETGQGIDLGLNHGLAYPYCTSRDVLPASVLADLGVHPRYLGNVMLTFRTYPIRVGNPSREGREVGQSGPFWDDSRELTWDELGVTPERTTVTDRVRRVATFSVEQYSNSCSLVEPSHIFLNFCNYLREDELRTFYGLSPRPTHIGYGPRPEQVAPWEPGILDRLFK